MTAGASRYVEIRLKRINLERGGRQVLHDVAWTVKPGERWVLVGGNGAGKTQLLKLLSGAVWPTPTGRESRRYVWKGEVFPTPADVKDEIAYVGPERQDKYERYGWNHSVTEVIGTGLYRTDIPLDPLTAKDRARIASLTKRIGIADLAEREFLTLSYGQRRLALLARALASRPGLLLLDELFAGLDEAYRARALKWLESTGRAAMPWVLATHRNEDVPSCATHALILDQGQVVYRGVLRRGALSKWLEHETGANVAKSAARAVSRAPGRDQSRSKVSSVPLIRLRNAAVYLDDYHALDALTFDVHPHDCWVIHGPNGSGKSTLLRTLYGDHGVASHGSIERAGITPGVSLQEFKVRAGFVAAHLQTRHPHGMTVDEIVQSGRHASIGLNDAPTAADRKAAAEALTFFGLEGFGSRTRDELSYGQMRRVLFARAWVTHPKLLLLDEPLAGIDAPTRSVLLDRIGQLVARGTAVVMTTHHRDEWPPYATHELQLEAGRMKYAGPMRTPAIGTMPATLPAATLRRRKRRAAE